MISTDIDITNYSHSFFLNILSHRADADRNAPHPHVAHHVRSLQQGPAEGDPAGDADTGKTVSCSG